MIKYITTIALTFAFSGTAHGQVQDCREIAADLDRLACYDRESGRTAETVAVVTASEWDVRISQSDMTDQTTVVLALEAEEPITCGMIRNSNKPVLVVRCSENTTAVYISTDCHLTSSNYDNYGDVTYRLDDTPSKTKRFNDSTDNTALGLWRGSNAIPFIKAMFGHESMLTRFTPYSENAVTARFPIAGLDDIIQPLRDACHW